MNNPTLVKTFKAGGTIPKHSIVMFGADDDTVVVSTAATSLLIGVTADVDVISGERVDVILDGVAFCLLGGTVTRGQKVTSDGSGRAVTAAPAAGVNNQIIGVAMVSGVVGDIGSIALWQSVMQG